MKKLIIIFVSLFTIQVNASGMKDGCRAEFISDDGSSYFKLEGSDSGDVALSISKLNETKTIRAILKAEDVKFDVKKTTQRTSAVFITFRLPTGQRAEVVARGILGEGIVTKNASMVILNFGGKISTGLEFRMMGCLN